MNCGNDENVVVKPMKFDWIVGMMKIMLLKPWNFMNYVNDENVVVKPMKFNWILGMMKMLMLNVTPQMK